MGNIGASNSFGIIHTKYAYLPEEDKVIEYQEICDLKNKEKYHDEICKRRKYVGIGYLVDTSFFTGATYCSDELYFIYV